MAFRRKLNPAQTSQSNLHLASGESGCCGDDGVVCKYRLVIAEESIEGINIVDENGDTVLIAISPAVSNLDAGATVKAITNALLANGLITDTDQPNINHFLNAEENPDTITLEIFSAVELVSIKHVGQVADALTETCVQNVACRYKFPLPQDADVDFTLDDEVTTNEQTVANLDTNTTPGTTATLSAISLAVQTALAALYGADYKQVLTKYDGTKDIEERYTVYFWLYSRDNKPEINLEAAGYESIELCECRRDYTAA